MFAIDWMKSTTTMTYGRQRQRTTPAPAPSFNSPINRNSENINNVSAVPIFNFDSLPSKETPEDTSKKKVKPNPTLQPPSGLRDNSSEESKQTSSKHFRYLTPRICTKRIFLCVLLFLVKRRKMSR